MTSPRTSLDLNFDFQKALMPILWQPSIITFGSCFVKCFENFLDDFCPDSRIQLSTSGESILPRLHSDFNPSIKNISEGFFRGKTTRSPDTTFRWIPEYTGTHDVCQFLSKDRTALDQFTETPRNANHRLPSRSTPLSTSFLLEEMVKSNQGGRGGSENGETSFRRRRSFET